MGDYALGTGLTGLYDSQRQSLFAALQNQQMNQQMTQRQLYFDAKANAFFYEPGGVGLCDTRITRDATVKRPNSDWLDSRIDEMRVKL